MVRTNGNGAGENKWRSHFFCPNCGKPVAIKSHMEDFRRTCPECEAVLLVCSKGSDPNCLAVRADVHLVQR